ncbi:MAG: alanine racemase [Cycloclasticus sp.]|nr:alanine racemase [Cycloclasticus sp.]MBQ0789670.1 alanine racemase [Cycloclasticus sp.]
MSNRPCATIDLAALKHNFSVVKQAAPHVKVMAVIKANGYGHGMLTVAEALSEADGFAVARLEEAITLRNAGYSKPIAVFTGFCSTEELNAFATYDLDAVIHSEYQVDLLAQVSLPKPISVWLKINTGMNRLGVEPSEVHRINDRLTLSGMVRQPIKLMTHLACADDMQSLHTEQQIELFDASIVGLSGEQSIANSAGLLGWQYSQRHWVRPGIMLYGASPFCEKSALELGLKPVMTLNSQVIALRTIKKDDYVGYGASWVADKSCLIATIGIGYGDGYPRHAATGTPVLINGQKGYLVGRVSMDSINVDVSECRGIKVGDTVELWGNGVTIDEVANKSGTISYELMCGVTERVKKLIKSMASDE